MSTATSHGFEMNLKIGIKAQGSLQVRIWKLSKVDEIFCSIVLCKRSMVLNVVENISKCLLALAKDQRMKRRTCNDWHTVDDFRSSCNKASSGQGRSNLFSNKDTSLNIPGVEGKGDNIWF